MKQTSIQKQLMKNFIKLMAATLALSFTVTTTHAQSRNAWYGNQTMQGEYLTLNPELVSIFNTLDSIFPKQYVINEEPHYVTMWVDYSFKNRKDYERHLDTIRQLIERMSHLPIYRSYIEQIDSTGIERYAINLTPKTNTYEQKDYAYLTITPKTMDFLYSANINGMKMPWERRQDVADAGDRLLDEYIHRTGVKQDTVAFDGTKTNYRRLSYTKPYDCIPHCTGIRYVVPHCTAADYDRIYRFIRSYALQNSITVTSNIVRRTNYEAVSFSVKQDNQRPLIIGAALKGTDLYLIRAEGEKGSQAWIPRAWAEDNPALHP